ncbi:MAG: alpha/beta hydrolase [Hyphomicrobiales bacterium]|nr:alpha/beta hydrolase [Hyphomicrobiales bacterium]
MDRGGRHSIEGSGPPIVLLHGFANCRESWRAFGLVERLVEAGRQVVLIDARGHGKSEKPYDMESYADAKRAGDVIAVLDALDIKAVDLCGYSMGGWIALAVASFYAHRVRSLIAIGAHGYAQNLSTFRSALGDNLDGWIGHIEMASGRPISPTLRNQLLTNDVDALWASVALDRTDLSGDVADARCPALLICGDRDPLWPDIVRFGRWISAWTVTLPGRNHFTMLGATNEIVSALMSFLNFVDKEQADPPRARYRPKRLLMADTPIVIETDEPREEAA